jgi:hypothetical protein
VVVGGSFPFLWLGLKRHPMIGFGGLGEAPRWAGAAVVGSEAAIRGIGLGLGVGIGLVVGWGMWAWRRGSLLVGWPGFVTKAVAGFVVAVRCRSRDRNLISLMGVVGIWTLFRRLGKSLLRSQWRPFACLASIGGAGRHVLLRSKRSDRSLGVCRYRE